MERATKTSQAFAVQTPRYSVIHRPSPVKRPQQQAKRGPGRPRKKLRQEDWQQRWYDAVEGEQRILLQVVDSYEAAHVTCYAEKASIAPVRPTKFQASFTAERRFEIREYALCNPDYSYQQIADSFGMPKTTVYDTIKRQRQPTGQPKKGRGNRKGAGRPLSYSPEVAGRF